MKNKKLLFQLFIFFLLFLSDRISSQTLYWQRTSDDYYILDLLYDGYEYLYLTASEGKIYRSSDKGVTWNFIGSGLNGKRLYRLAIDSSGTLWGGNDESGGIYKSSNHGNNWSLSYSSNDKILSISVSNNNWVWAGSDNGKIIYSSDNGANWNIVTVSNKYVWDIKSNMLNYIFAGMGTGDGLYRSTDLGLTWEKIFGTGGFYSIRDIVIDEFNYIYATTPYSRIISYDSGDNWTVIPGIELESLYLDENHIFYGGVITGGYRSFDNCLTWTLIGPVYPNYPRSFVFIDSLIFVGTSNGVFMYDPSYQPYIGENYFPLNVGNAWQFNQRCNGSFSGNTLYKVLRDTTISNKKYFLLQGSINDWLRYDTQENKLFSWWNDSDQVVMDFTLNQGSIVPLMQFNYHAIKNATINEPAMISIFDSLYYSKSNSWYEGFGIDWWGYRTYYSEQLGISRINYNSSGPGGLQYNCTTKLIRAIISDSTGTNYYSDQEKPIIDFQPVSVTHSFNLNWELQVDHYYGKLDNSWNVNFIDSVLMYSFYSNGDSVLPNNPYIAINEPNSTNYVITYTLDSILMKNNYSFYYQIYAIDKGIVPEYSIKPDTGYYKLIYDPNTLVEEMFTPLFTFSLSQNYPNPFNPTTKIKYSIPSVTLSGVEGSLVTLKIYDVLGREVATLVNEEKQPGAYEVEFNASQLSSGIYFYKLQTEGFSSTMKMILLR